MSIIRFYHCVRFRLFQRSVPCRKTQQKTVQAFPHGFLLHWFRNRMRQARRSFTQGGKTHAKQFWEASGSWIEGKAAVRSGKKKEVVCFGYILLIFCCFRLCMNQIYHQHHHLSTIKTIFSKILHFAQNPPVFSLRRTQKRQNFSTNWLEHLTFWPHFLKNLEVSALQKHGGIGYNKDKL